MLADPAIQSQLPLGRHKQISIYLSIYYYFSSMYSLARETALGYIPNAAQLAGSTESVV